MTYCPLAGALFFSVVRFNPMFNYDIVWEYMIDGQIADGLYEADSLDAALAFIKELAIDPDIHDIKLIKHI